MSRFFSILFVILILFSANNLEAQLPKASEFFPLQIGNVWEYVRSSDSFPTRHIEIVGDTLFADTVRIYKASIRYLYDPDAGVGYNYYHYNQDSTVVYHSRYFPEEPFIGDFPINWPLINTKNGLNTPWDYFMGDYLAFFAITDTGTSVYFGRKFKWAQVREVRLNEDSLTVLPTIYFDFIAGVGQFHIQTERLVYAKINGNEYGTAVAVKQNEVESTTPKTFNIDVYPNPFSSYVTISTNNIPEHLNEIKIINILGQTIRVLQTNNSAIAHQQFIWDGRDNNGLFVNSGIYFVVCQCSAIINSKKIILIR